MVGLDPTQVIIAISGLLVAVVTATTGVVVAIINSKPRTPTTVASSSLDPDDWAYVRERVAVLERRANDNDNRDETQDRRLDQVERVLDLDNANWRHEH